MSNVIRLNKKPLKVNTFDGSAAALKTTEEIEKDNLQIAMHNQYVQGLAEGKESVKEELQKQVDEYVASME